MQKIDRVLINSNAKCQQNTTNCKIHVDSTRAIGTSILH